VPPCVQARSGCSDAERVRLAGWVAAERGRVESGPGGVVWVAERAPSAAALLALALPVGVVAVALAAAWLGGRRVGGRGGGWL
jgi:hypothetical protein